MNGPTKKAVAHPTVAITSRKEATRESEREVNGKRGEVNVNYEIYVGPTDSRTVACGRVTGPYRLRKQWSSPAHGKESTNFLLFWFLCNFCRVILQSSWLE